MAISERDRRDAYTGLEQALGENIANTIMQLLPNQPADQLVTRTDMHAFGAELRGEMAELRGDLKGDMAELRSELKGEITQVKGEMSKLKGEVAELRADVIDRLATAKVETQRLIMASMVGNAIAVATALAV